MQELSFNKERACRKEGRAIIVGVDEAGRGPLAGPVVAAAAMYRDQADFAVSEELGKLMRFVRDSKMLSEKKRDEMHDFVREYFVVGIGVVHSGTIDRMNILEATFLAMKEAASDLLKQIRQDARYKMQDTNKTQEAIDKMQEGTRESCYFLIDGNQRIPNFSYPQEAIVDGDALVRSIAAASIVAKVTRDRMMLEYDQAYPAYGFARHKGYGTKEHMDALRKHGACPIHRMSFKPVFYSVPENVNRNLLSRKKR